MNSNIPNVAMTPGIGWLRFWLPLLLGLLLAGNAWGGTFTACTDLDKDLSLSSCDNSDCSYATTAGTPVNETIMVNGASADVEWEFIGTCPSGNTATTTECLGMTVEIPAPMGTTTSPGNPVTIIGNATAGPAGLNAESFTLTVGDGVNPNCERTYIMRVTSTGGGWGDPHITTVDGVNYDFQSAGEFIALRGDGIEVQTRQTAVSKQNVSGTNPYTGIASCVSLYTAVAARVGPHRVTIQPNISGIPDPSGLQIRVDGVLKALGPEGIDLSSCDCPATEVQLSGRIVRSADDKGIEIHFTDGTKLVVTPAWWEGQQKWYLNVNIYDTTASEGIMGRTAEDWLPALSNGSTVGPKAEDMDDRYDQLYETFADSWRVTDANSLFDYAPGTSTATFTDSSWPRKNPSNCLIKGEPTAEPVDEAVAEEACKNVVDANNRENCIFDVRETGHLGFADTYERSEQLAPGATRTLLVADKNSSTPGTNVTFTATVMRATSTVARVTSGGVQFVLNGSDVGDPVALDDGEAVWSTLSLQAGTHQIVAKYIPSLGFGEQFLASSSPEVDHTVVATNDKLFWLIVLLIIALIAAIVWRYLSRKKSHAIVNSV